MTKLVSVRDIDAAGRAEILRMLSVCFGDTPEYGAALMRAAADERFCFALEAGKPAGGAFFFEARLFPGGGASCARGLYVFALGVLPQCRGRGFSREILETAKAASKDFTLIAPADEVLAAYYARCGFDRFLPGTAPVESGGTEPEAACARFLIGGGYAEAERAAGIHGGILLSEPLLSFSLTGAGASLRFLGDAYIAAGNGRLFAACGLPLQNPAARKVQLYEKHPLGICADIYADLLLEY